MNTLELCFGQLTKIFQLIPIQIYVYVFIINCTLYMGPRSFANANQTTFLLVKKLITLSPLETMPSNEDKSYWNKTP